MSLASSRTVLQPASVEEVQALIHSAVGDRTPLEVIGTGGKRAYGRPVEAERVMSVARLTGVVDYQPQELLLVARPGTPLAELEATLAEAGQGLAFEPPHWAPGATLGGVVACNLSGPRRFKAGAARDHLLGFQAVTGTGEVVRGGGRVVKNVTGYDLPKLMCGSFGTLVVMTELALKVLPRAETECTVLFQGLSDGEGLERLGTISRSHHEPSALAHLPAPVARICSATEVAAGGALTAVRLEGPEPSVRQRSGALGAGAAALLDAEPSRAFWREVRELALLELTPQERLWRLSVPPGSGAALGQRLGESGVKRLCYDWGGALLWAAAAGSVKPATIHALAADHGGHAQLVRQGADCLPVEPPFSALSEAQQRLNLNLKRSFDPHRVLNPGRMYADL